MSNLELSCSKDFITIEEQTELCNIAADYFKQGVLEANPRGPHRYRAKIWGTEYCTPFIMTLGKRIIEHFKLEGCLVDPHLGWIISVIEKGGQIHKHRDKYAYHVQNNVKHLRCNIMVTRENATANPVIEDQIIDVPARAIWGFFPSESEHCTQLLDVEEPRIVYQFGFVVPMDYTLPVY
jgi:hypothetical protein